MEILDLKFAGIPVSILLAGIGIFYFARGSRDVWREWRDQRAFKKEMDEMKKHADETVWMPRMNNGVDQGEWVRKDGRPL